jgi:hypothetical protein
LHDKLGELGDEFVNQRRETDDQAQQKRRHQPSQLSIALGPPTQRDRFKNLLEFGDFGRIHVPAVKGCAGIYS